MANADEPHFPYGGLGISVGSYAEDLTDYYRELSGLNAAQHAGNYESKRAELIAACTQVINNQFAGKWATMLAQLEVAAAAAAAGGAGAGAGGAAAAAFPVPQASQGAGAAYLASQGSQGGLGGGYRRTRRHHHRRRNISDMSWLRRRVNSLSLFNLQREENRLSEEEDHEMPGRGWARVKKAGRRTRRHRRA